MPNFTWLAADASAPLVCEFAKGAGRRSTVAASIGRDWKGSDMIGSSSYRFPAPGVWSARLAFVKSAFRKEAARVVDFRVANASVDNVLTLGMGMNENSTYTPTHAQHKPCSTPWSALCPAAAITTCFWW
jgi:hypothetical protein